MKKINVFIIIIFLVLCSNFSLTRINAQIVPVGSGSYTKTFPGVDVASRNTYPTGSPLTSGMASTKPVPTNDWWSSKLKNDHVNNLFNYPLAFRTVNSGLVVSYIPAPSGANGSSQPMDDFLPITVGVSDLAASRATVSDYSDFDFTMNWANSTHSFNARIGIAMPFIYFTKNQTDIAKVVITEGTVTLSGEMIIIQNSHNGADFAIYAPTGSTWTQSGNIYTSNLNDKNYWSMAYIPPTAADVAAVANEYKKYAYVFPANTEVSYQYNEANSTIRSHFQVTTDIKEGIETDVLLGLLPHHWSHLSGDSPIPGGYSYPSIRGEIKTLAGNEFFVENVFHGILPTLPYLDNYSPGFNPAKLNEKIQLLENEGLSTWTDSYNEGQVMNRLIQTARIADLTGNTEARDKMLATIKERLEDWLKAEAGEVAFLFYYNSIWTSMIGYPAGHGQDGNLNDHHFHWGYFIHAASFIQQFDSTWADSWGEMINLLVRDAASSNRNDDLFPYLRNFSPYAGHCWANGFATFPFGNDQESTSESMQFNSSLIHWGSITGNDEIRDLGIYLYTTEQTAIEEYWLDIHERNFKPEYNFSLVSRIWGNGYDNQTFWTSDIAAAYGIEMYPIHGGSLYLGHNKEYVQKLWAEIAKNTGILTNAANDNLWHDVMWEYLAFIDPQAAINLYDSYPNRSLKFGISDVQTYYWLNAMNALGFVIDTISADYPIAAAFIKEGTITYTAHNYSDADISVRFSDGFVLNVPAKKMATSRDISISGILTTSYPQAYTQGSVELTMTGDGGVPTLVEFYDGTELVSSTSEAPFSTTASNLKAGKHSFYAKVYEGTEFNVSNIVSVIVGNQIPYSGAPVSVPGTIEAGLFDKFEGGNGQGISYSDVSVVNEGGFRPEEYVDAGINFVEGAVVGWISTGEWMEYTIKVDNPGLYSLSFRYASGNGNGGGPFYLESDGKQISDSIYVSSTTDWDKWSTKVVNNIPLNSGEQVLRLVFSNGEVNLGKMTFSYSEPLPYSQPVADAGSNIIVITPESSATLNGTGSSDPASGALTYLWTQVYGPTVGLFSDNSVPDPVISNLSEGIYLIRLSVSNGSYTDTDELYVIVSSTASIPPVVSISAPEDNAEFIEGTEILISAVASDLDGHIQKVEFYIDGILMESVFSEPFSINWTAIAGEYEIIAVAYDDGNNTGNSAPVNIIFTLAPPCDGVSYNGDYKYEFSAEDSNPTLTFIPSKTGVGSPTCILYYSTNANPPFPGYNVTPNTPYRLSAKEGATVYFYYTYSYPGQGEKNTMSNMDTYVVGSCLPDPNTGIVTDSKTSALIYYPNPVTDVLNLQLTDSNSTIRVYSMDGKIIDVISAGSDTHQYNMEGYEAGIYFVEVIGKYSSRVLKIVKE
ncbi:MAG: carbohydrate-binding protein [Bacteroidales bacterium]|nr:carbohydrate-binding protein [Bacteroidales bacterium]MCF8391158.1 carbohydrate-binding protein [Bacteroidales bacterium]